MPRIVRAQALQARTLRRAETPAERELWRWLRGRRLDGAKFRRQHPLGPYIADFFCAEAALDIEADGAGHFPPPVGDRLRDSWLTGAGLTVLRFENHEVLHNTSVVLARIREAIGASRSAVIAAICDESDTVAAPEQEPLLRPFNRHR